MATDGNQKQYHTGGWSAHYIMIVCTLLFIINYMDRQVFSAVLQPMKVELGLSDAQCGLVATIFTLGMALFSFPIAYMVDRWSRKKTIGIMGIMWSIASMVCAFVGNFAQLFTARTFLGVGEAGYGAGGTAMITGMYRVDKRALMFGIFGATAFIANAAAVALGGFIAVRRL